MAAFIIGKSMKDRRQTKAIEDLFDDADKNRNGRISVKEYVNIFNEHGIDVSEDEIARVSDQRMYKENLSMASPKAYGNTLSTIVHICREAQRTWWWTWFQWDKKNLGMIYVVLLRYFCIPQARYRMCLCSYRTVHTHAFGVILYQAW